MLTLIFLNGRLPASGVINFYLKKKGYVIAADGGANLLRKRNVVPDIIVGDFDSVSKRTLEHYKKLKTDFRKVEEQRTCDFEKCLLFCLEKRKKRIIVFGATSLRPDHTLNNLSVLKRYSKRLEIKIVTDEFDVSYVGRKTEFSYVEGETISLLGIPEAKGVSATGLKYPVENMDFGFGTNEGTLNIAAANRITISVNEGSLLLFKKHFINTKLS